MLSLILGITYLEIVRLDRKSTKNILTQGDLDSVLNSVRELIEKRILDMNANGLLGSLCFPSLPGFAGRLFGSLEDKKAADIVDILSRNRRLRLRFARILKRAADNAHAGMRGLVQAGVMRASAAEVEATATNILVVATFWLNYASVRGDRDEHEAIRQGIVQVMMLLSPLLRDAERVHLNTLTQAYLA